MTDHLIQPHGGTLVDLLVDEDRRGDLQAASRDWPSWNLTSRQVCDLELLMNGSFSPLRGFMGRADYESICGSMRLADGTLWPIPVMLDVSEESAEGLTSGGPLHSGPLLRGAPASLPSQHGQTVAAQSGDADGWAP